MRIIDEVEEGSKRDFYDEILLYKEVSIPDVDFCRYCSVLTSSNVLLLTLFTESTFHSEFEDIGVQ